MSNSIIRSLPSQFIQRCHYRNLKATTKVYKPCLSFFISFSFSGLSHSFHRLSLSSLTSSTPQHSQSAHATYELVHRILPFSQSVHATYETMMACQSYFIVLTVRTRDVRDHDKTWMACQPYFIVLTVRTATYETMTKLKWLVNRILSFSQSVHATYETMTDFSQCGARSGSPQSVANYTATHSYS